MIPASCPWYESEADFKAVLSMVSAEESRIAVDYAGWQAHTEKFEQGMKAAGYIPFRIIIKPTALKEWCDAQGLNVCRQSIATYAGLQMTERLNSSGGN